MVPLSPSTSQSLNMPDDNAVSIADEGIGSAAEVEQPIPVGVIARQPRDLQSEHDANLAERYFGG